MDSTSVAACVFKDTMAYTLYSSTTNLDWGSKVWTVLFIISNFGLWLFGFALGFNVGFTSQITLIVSDPSANIL